MLYLSDSSTESATQMLNLRTRQWDAGILAQIGVPAAWLPRVAEPDAAPLALLPVVFALHTMSSAFGAPLLDLDSVDVQRLPRGYLDGKICQAYRVVVLAKRNASPKTRVVPVPAAKRMSTPATSTTWKPLTSAPHRY